MSSLFSFSSYTLFSPFLSYNNYPLPLLFFLFYLYISFFFFLRFPPPPPPLYIILTLILTFQGFSAELSASSSRKCLAHVTLPVEAYFFKLSDDDAPSPYMVYMSLVNILVFKTLGHEQ